MITNNDLITYRLMDSAEVNISAMTIFNEMEAHDLAYALEEEELVKVANIIYDVWLKDEEDRSLGTLTYTILENYTEILEKDIHGREILREYF